VWTGARDENGDLVAPTADDPAHLGAEQYGAYQRRREEDRTQRAEAHRDKERFERFKVEFVRSGRAPADAKKVYEDWKRDQAAAAARKAEVEAHPVHTATTMGMILRWPTPAHTTRS
jgi:hypothetical protein